MAEDDIGTVAVIDAENKAHDVLMGAVQDFKSYQSAVQDGSQTIRRATSQASETLTRAHRLITKHTKDSVEVTEEYVETIQKGLVPAYNDVIDAQFRVLDSEEALSRTTDEANDVYEERKNLLQQIANLTLGGRAAEKGLETAVPVGGRTVSAGDVGGALVTTAIAADRANVAYRAYTTAIEGGATATQALKVAANETTKGVQFLAKAGKVAFGVLVQFSVILFALPRGFIAARAAGTGMFMSLIAGVRAFTVALIASPLAPYILAILALVVAFKALKGMFSLFRDEIKQGVAEAFAPWIEAWTEFRNEFLRKLAPAIAVAIALFGALAGTVKFIANSVLLPVVRFVGRVILQIMDWFNSGLLAVVDITLGILQPVVDFIYVWINSIRTAFAIFTSDKSPAEKFRLMGRLVVAYTLEMVKGVISLSFALVEGMTRAIGLVLKVVVEPIGWLVKQVMRMWQFLRDNTLDIFIAMVTPLAGIIAKGFNAIIFVINSAIDAINFMSFGLVNLRKVGMVTADGLVQGLTNVKDGLHDAHQAVINFVDGIKINPDVFTAPFEVVKNRVLDTINEIQSRFGFDLKDIAGEVGVTLLTAPDLKAGFQKILSQVRLKIEDRILGEKLDALGEKVEKVNDKNISIEINPLIQLNVTENVDAERARAILFPLIDQALTEGAARLGQQIYTANIGNV